MQIAAKHEPSFFSNYYLSWLLNFETFNFYLFIKFYCFNIYYVRISHYYAKNIIINFIILTFMLERFLI